jgi:hypothetical protein
LFHPTCAQIEELASIVRAKMSRICGTLLNEIGFVYMNPRGDLTATA